MRLDDEVRSAGTARALLLVAAGAQIVGWVGFRHTLRQLFDQLSNLDSSSPPSMFALDPYVLLARLPGLAAILAGVVFLVWFARSANNARALGLPARRDTTASVFGFIVPVINLWWPYQSMSDLLPADDPNRSHVLRWFLLWVAGGFVSLIVLVVSAAVSGWPGWLLLVIPAAQVALAALAARQVVAEVVDAHGALAGGPSAGANPRTGSPSLGPS